ncbi:MAG: tetratricopeptide repeat protein, partial [Gammaproteobacteria bacterium]|nr:tetratricopeptide repeat protein [Gammaproteobacteria bacterium]
MRFARSPICHPITAFVLTAITAGSLAACAPATPPPPPTFAGSTACADCHAQPYASWRGSQHALAMQEATEATVLGDFDDATITAHGVTSRFFRRDGRFVINTDGPDGQPADFELKYTFGVAPLQQYLVPFPDGRLQALGIAWDARPAEAGGQRWFHLYPDQTLKAGNPLHWTGLDQNWNYQCADCHSTNLRKNYDADKGRFTTTWSEISVGCEACHGPASNHVAWARKDLGWHALAATRGLANALDERRGVNWAPREAGTAARSAPRATSREIDTCARCHARRGQYSDDIHAGQPWLDAFRPALIEPGLYFPDGQQRDEVYTWGSFVQSRMHAAGVTCADCHEPHTQRLRAPGNGVCAQCHAPAVFDTAEHHHHPAGSAGTQCIACHMPATTYMVVDPRHDHSLRIPRPDLSVGMGTPNACGGCHDERGARWAAAAVARWYPDRRPGFQTFAVAFATAERGEPAAAAKLIAIMEDPAQPALVRASALARATRYPSQEVIAATIRALADPDALVRATAAGSLAAATPAERAEGLAPLLRDPVRLVRMAAARGLVGEPQERLLGEEPAAFAAALEEWVAGQRFNADRPEALTNLGTLALERGAPRQAVFAFRRALALDPSFTQAAVNLADLHRAGGDEVSAERVLRRALERNPDDAAARHALGLSLVRQGRSNDALAELRRAYQLAPEAARFAFVYAVALHDTGQPAAAIATLREAI